MRDLQALVDAADDAALLAAVDGLAASRQWDTLADLARRCREAVEFGKQLWGVAMHIDYRLAWEGPPAHAAATLRSGASRFTLGPLTEVAASTHTWDEVGPLVEDPASARAFAQERVIRGERLAGRAPTEAGAPPLVALGWEPQYALPTYRDRSARFPAPEAAGELTGRAQPMPVGGDLVPDDAGARALAEVVGAWTTESSGEARVVAVEGDARQAVGALATSAVVVEVVPADALAVLQWAAASGGAQGRRRGGAAGRFSALWTFAALAGMPWPDVADETGERFFDDLGDAATELHWFRWRRDEAERGWVLRLAATDPLDGLSWAIEAVDAIDDDALTEPV